MNMFGAKSSTCGNVNDVAGGRKAIQSIAAAASGTGEAVLVSLGRDDAVVFSDEVKTEVESVPSLETDEEDDDEEEDWESEEEEYDEEDAELDEGLAERLRILADARALKTLATAFLHPERPVEVTDPAVFGRNYFVRPSAPEQEEDELADERADILADAEILKQAARAYLHPEEGVKGAPETFGRNYFNRYSAPEHEDAKEAAERAKVLEEAAALKQSAMDYMHPEVGVTSTAGTCFGRNYFNRYSAPEQEDELADERAEILADAAALKQSAVDYMHPEVGIKAAAGACFGRNYFNRYSAPEQEDDELADERAEILADAAALKQSAVDYMHPEVGVTTTDPTLFGRNYFNRYSAPEMDAPKVEETPEASEDLAAVKNLAAAIKGANLPSTKSIKLSSAGDHVDASKKSASTVNLFGLSEEAF